MFALLGLHLLAAAIWVGGMFFAYVCLRPAAVATLEPAQRLSLWSLTLFKFFNWVWLAVIILIITGHGMIGVYGGMKVVGTHIHIMLATGYLMMLIYAHLFFSPFKKLKRAVAAEQWQEAGKFLSQIRLFVAINLGLGLFTLFIASGGKFLL